MFIFRKNIILIPSDYDGMSLTKGLVSFDCYDTKTKCSLHCYNLKVEKPLVLGVSVNNKLHKINVPKNSIKNFQFELETVLNAENQISVVLLDVRDADYDIVLWGSTQISDDWKTSLDLMLTDVDIVPHKNVAKENFENVTKDFGDVDNEIVQDASHDFDDGLLENSTKNTTNTQKNTVFESKNDENYQKNAHFYQNKTDCLYQKCNQNLEDSKISNNENTFDGTEKPEKYAYEEDELNNYIDHILDLTESKKSNYVSVENNDEVSPKVSQENFDNLHKETFFERINPQIEKMFATSKSMNVLSEIIPNSKFCRVDFDDESGYYVFGVIYDEGSPKYLCYGVPAKKDGKPPKELSNLYQWLPIDAEDEFGDGFYMMYQDASTGENISVDII